MNSSLKSSLSPFLQEGPCVIAYLIVHPGAKKNKIVKIDSKSLRIDIKAVPKGGEANATLFEFFSNLLGLPISSFVLKKGHTSHKKVLLIKNCSLPDILQKIAAYT